MTYHLIISNIQIDYINNYQGVRMEIEKKKKKLGRPSGYTKEMADKICNMVAQGSNINKISVLEGMPDYGTIYFWLNKHPEFFNGYMRARETRADWRADKVDEVMQDMRDGIIDYNQAKVQLEAIKWQAGNEAPQKYGNAMTLRGDKANPIELKLADRLLKAESVLVDITPDNKLLDKVET